MENSLSRLLITTCMLWIAGVAHGQGEQSASEQKYPARAVRLIVPFAPGSGADIIARVIGQKLSERWQQPVIVDDHVGAAGTIGADLAAKSAPDGYTLLMGNIATHGSNPAIYKKLPYDAIADFSPVILIAKASNVLTVHPALPVRTVADLIALARKKPGQLNFGSSGVGTGSHLPMEFLKFATGINIVHVPYKGSSQSLTALLSGEVEIVFTGALSVLPYIRADRLRPLAVSSLRRIATLPQVPTMVESGVSGYEADLWYGMLVPAKVPAAIVTAINEAVSQILLAPEMKSRLLEQGADIVGGTPEQFAAFIRTEIDKWTKVAKAAGIRAD